MKLYTRPRPIDAWRVRPGDQLATFKRGGAPVRSEASYVDEDLDERIAWSVVHAADPMGASSVRITHTLGEHDVTPGQTVIIREVIEIDPWTYLSQQAAA